MAIVMVDPACKRHAACLGVKCDEVPKGRDYVTLAAEQADTLQRGGVLLAENIRKRAVDSASRVYQAKQRQHEYLAKIAPFVQIMANLAGLQPMRYVCETGLNGEILSMKPEIQWDEGMKCSYDECEAMIKEIARDYINLEGL